MRVRRSGLTRYDTRPLEGLGPLGDFVAQDLIEFARIAADDRYPLREQAAVHCRHGHRLDDIGVKRGDVVHAGVPGALEIPLALKWLAQSGRVDALVAVGVVIRGETYHFEIVANESARGVMQVALDSGLPVANAILTTENEAQAEARLDKAAEAVRVAVELARLRADLAEHAA